jgi:outer membrane protein assembly factor BamD (BamD/ComL family)
MSVTGISLGNLLDYGTSQSTQSKMKQMEQEFEHLGQDLQSGDLSAAQSDFATLEQLNPNSTTSTSSTSTSSTSTTENPIQQAFAQLSKDLQSGNLTAAQQDYTTIEQDMQSASTSSTGHHHHHVEDNAVSNTFSQLGTALQSGDLSSAQSLYSTLEQEFEQLGENSSLSSLSTSSSTASTNTVSLSA